MKNTEIIQFAALFALGAALLYRKYGKKNKAKDDKGPKVRSTFSSAATDDDYEPYSKNNNKSTGDH